MDYEKKYKDILAKAREIHRNEAEKRSDMEWLFPEPKNKDERIRKALVRFRKSTIDIDGIKGADILAWLEKQGKSSGQIHYWTEEELDQAAEEYSLGHSVRKECFIDGALWMKEKLKRNDTKD